jgi:uncharacterized membrane protein YeaQ/YmgE (transglycosylase-associated protein family)
MTLRIVVWLALGGVLGILACLLRAPGARWRMPLNVTVGMLGALIGGLLLAPVVGMDARNHATFGAGAAFVACVWASVLLALMNLFRMNAAPTQREPRSR